MLISFIVISCLIISCYTDIKERKIPNYITFGLMISGLAYNTLAGPGLLYSLSGILAGFVLFFLPYLFTGMGAGDIKLIMGVGAVFGFHYILYIGIISSLIAAAYAVIILSNQGKLKSLLQLTVGQASYILTKTRLHDFSREMSVGWTIPYAVPITISTLAVWLWGWLR